MGSTGGSVGVGSGPLRVAVGWSVGGAAEVGVASFSVGVAARLVAGGWTLVSVGCGGGDSVACSCTGSLAEVSANWLPASLVAVGVTLDNPVSAEA